jgi:hypothetical protein
MQFIARRIAIEFRQPEFLPVRGRGAVFTAFVSVPKTAGDEDGGFVFRQDDVHGNEARFQFFGGRVP